MSTHMYTTQQERHDMIAAVASDTRERCTKLSVQPVVAIILGNRSVRQQTEDQPYPSDDPYLGMVYAMR